jgi:hypothetical protein
MHLLKILTRAMVSIKTLIILYTFVFVESYLMRLTFMNLFSKPYIHQLFFILLHRFFKKRVFIYHLFLVQTPQKKVVGLLIMEGNILKNHIRKKQLTLVEFLNSFT